MRGGCEAPSGYAGAMIRVGPAGFDYRDWAGIVYPRPRPKGFDPLAYLARCFDTIEINSSFYRPPTPAVCRAWCDRVDGNADFRFTAKLWRRFTHEREAFGAAEVAEARAGLETLRDAGRLGAVLVQFPWSFRNQPEHREWLGDVLAAFGGFPLALEVRHASWNAPDVYAELLERGVGFVNIDQPLFRDSLKPSARRTAAVAYIRAHGRNWRDWWRADAQPHERYDYLYTAEELAPWADAARSLAADAAVDDVYVVTNNHYEGQAVANAAMLRSMLEQRQVPVPPSLLAADRYHALLEPYAQAMVG